MSHMRAGHGAVGTWNSSRDVTGSTWDHVGSREDNFKEPYRDPPGVDDPMPSGRTPVPRRKINPMEKVGLQVRLRSSKTIFVSKSAYTETS